MIILLFLTFLLYLASKYCSFHSNYLAWSGFGLIELFILAKIFVYCLPWVFDSMHIRLLHAIYSTRVLCKWLNDGGGGGLRFDLDTGRFLV